MHIHILGICGTFMGSLALLARELGHTVTGSDANVYPPMSTQLKQAGVNIMAGYASGHLKPAPDLVIVGNVMKRGMEVVEYMLNEGLAYTSGPQFLAEQVLQHRHVIAVAGTHGKTTTTTMLAWILHYNGIDTGFLIGGVPLVNSDNPKLTKAFAHSSYLGSANNSNALQEQRLSKDNNQPNNQPNNQQGYFVIEADEYDAAFFDKRSKFVHYRPRTAILNNLEFDHADIFADLNAIQTQFHHLIRMIPSDGRIIMSAHSKSLEQTIAKGCWTPIWRTQVVEKSDHNQSKQTAVSNWQAELIRADGSQFQVHFDGHITKKCGATIKWQMNGLHNVANALVAIAAAYDVGITVQQACEALSNFAGIKRRMELIADIRFVNSKDNKARIQVYDDFAHHPTAIATTLDGAVKHLKDKHIWAIIEPRSNTMQLGIHKDNLATSAKLADTVIWYEPNGLKWGLKETIAQSGIANKQLVMNDIQAIINYITANVGVDDVIIIMSNGGFEGIHSHLINAFSPSKNATELFN